MPFDTVLSVVSLRTLQAAPAVFVLSMVLGYGLSTSQAAPTPIFTAVQADAGRTAYGAKCASCHMADLGGRDEAPALAGDSFMSGWKARSAKELVEFIRDTMPPEGPALSTDESITIVAHMLRENGAAAGSQMLTETTTATLGSVATGKRPQLARTRLDRINVALSPPGGAGCLASRHPQC